MGVMSSLENEGQTQRGKVRSLERQKGLFAQSKIDRHGATEIL